GTRCRQGQVGAARESEIVSDEGNRQVAGPRYMGDGELRIAHKAGCGIAGNVGIDPRTAEKGVATDAEGAERPAERNVVAIQACREAGCGARTYAGRSAVVARGVGRVRGDCNEPR